MRLKRLELSGFKSFVEPTKIELGNGINAIVGPNGCGKSNIVDAIRWVLGEHSARHLRGGIMDDLIFQGSDTRPPISVCDVELTFAVQRGKLSPPYHDMEEIRIRRRLIRDGGSDAFINGKMVRIKDIVDLFLDTGVSTRAYAIVEQGSIARMITAKPEERRQLLEEAAGVMKYRSRRKEAERKMNSTRQNMERVEDLLEEVRTQCRSLKQQASRAERFKVMQAEFEQNQSKALAIRFHQQQTQLQAFHQQLQKADSLLEAAQTEHTQKERILTQTRRGTVSHDEDVQQAQEQLRQCEQQRAELQRQAERLAGENRLLLERENTLKQRIQESHGRQQQLRQELEGIQEQLSKQNDHALKQQCSDAKEQVEHAYDTLQQARQKRDILLRELEQLRSHFNDLEQRRTQTHDNLTRISEKMLAVQTQEQELQQKITANKQALQAANENLALLITQRQSTEAQIQEGQTRLDQCREQQAQALEKRKLAEQQVRTLGGHIQELNAQLEQQDMPADLREKLHAFQGTWVDEALTVPEALEQAVAAALRGKQGDVALPKDVNYQTLCAQIENSPVAIHIAHSQQTQTTSLAQALDMDAQHPLYGMFCQVLLCDDIASADIPTYGCVVSRDGWRLEADGWLIPPAKSQTARRLNMQRRLKTCKKELKHAEAALRESEHAAETAELALIDQQQQWQTAHLANTQAQSDVQAAQALLQRLQDEENNLSSRQQQLSNDTQALKQEQEHWQTQQSNLQQMDAQKLAHAEQALEAQSLLQQQYEQQWQQTRSAQAHADQALALYAQTLTSLERDADRMQQELLQLEQREKHDQEQLAHTQTQLQEHQQHQNLDAQLSSAHDEVEQAHQALTQMREQGHQLQQRLRQHEQHEVAARQHVQQHADDKQQVEIRQASHQARLQDLSDEIEQRCQCTAEQLLQQHKHVSDEDMEQVLRQTRELEDKLSRFGPVNLLAIEEFKQTSEREQFLAEQVADLDASLNTLKDTISRIDRTTRQRFKDTFDKTNAYFQKTFPTLFGGGRAELKLDSDDVLTAGVEVIAQPPGKRLQDITLLSGGEKALTAVALVFSIFRINPAPFCILDEVDAPLDDANVGRFADMISEFSDDVQFLAISHNKITMQKADKLIGVSMPEPGVSKIVSVDMEAIPHI